MFCFKRFDISTFDTSSVKNMRGMFSGFGALRGVNFQSKNEIFEDMDMAQYQGYTSLDLSHFDTSSVINMDAMFNFNIFLYLDISNFNMNNVESYQGMFDEPKRLQYINLFNVQDKNEILKNSPINNMNISLSKRSTYNKFKSN